MFVYFYSSPDTIPGRQCMASCFFLLKQFEDVLIYLNSVKVSRTYAICAPSLPPVKLYNRACIVQSCMHCTIVHALYNRACIVQSCMYCTIGTSKFPSIGKNNSLKSRLDMKDNSKCITISLSTSTWSHCFVSIVVISGRI